MRRRRRGSLTPDRVGASLTARAAIWCYVVFAFVQGVNIIVAPEERFSSTSFVIMTQAPGGVDTWGQVLITLGALLAVSSALRMFHVKAVALTGVSVWCGLWGLASLDSVLTYPTAGPTGWATYFLVATVASVLTLVDERRPTGAPEEGHPRA